MSTVVGLDLSLTSTGLAIHIGTIDGLTIHTATSRITSKGKADAAWHERSARLTTLVNNITEQVPTGSLVIVEAPSYASVGGAQHDRSGLWWQTYQALERKGCTIIPATPSQRMKYATGKGNAQKDLVLAAAIRRYPHIDITGNDEADAVILMAMGLRLTGHPIDGALPKAHLDAMAKLSLPEAAAA